MFWLSNRLFYCHKEQHRNWRGKPRLSFLIKTASTSKLLHLLHGMVSLKYQRKTVDYNSQIRGDQGDLSSSQNKKKKERKDLTSSSLLTAKPYSIDPNFLRSCCCLVPQNQRKKKLYSVLILLYDTAGHWFDKQHQAILSICSSKNVFDSPAGCRVHIIFFLIRFSYIDTFDHNVTLHRNAGGRHACAKTFLELPTEPILCWMIICYLCSWFIMQTFILCIFSEGPEHGLSHFWLTDSCPLTVKAVKDRQPFEILSLAGPIASALQI